MFKHFGILILMLISVVILLNLQRDNIPEILGVISLVGYYVNFIIYGANVLQWDIKGPNPLNVLLA